MLKLSHLVVPQTRDNMWDTKDLEQNALQGCGVGWRGEWMAARQLAYFGVEVIVLEPRDHIGGRIHTFRSGPYTADLGAMVITGLGGNPLSVLKRQIDLKMTSYRVEDTQPFCAAMSYPDIGAVVIDASFDDLFPLVRSRIHRYLHWFHGWRKKWSK